MSNEDNNVSEVTETTTTIDTAMPNMPKKHNKLVPIVIVLLAVLVILGGGFYYYFSRPSKIVSGLINSAYNNFSNALHKTNDFDFKKDTIRVSGDLNIDTNIDGLEDLKKETFNYTLGLDYANKKIELGGALVESKKSLIDVIAYVIDEKIYVSLKDDYDKLIKVDADDVNLDLDGLWDLEDVDIKTEDIDYIVKEFKDILIDSIDYDALEKTSATTKIDGKSVSVTKITYNLNTKNTKKFLTKFINNTLDNKDLLNKLADISDTDVSDIKDSLKDALDDLKDSDIEEIGKINIYTKGILNTVVKVELVDKDDKDNNLGYVVNKDNTEIYLNAKDTKIVFTIKENTDEKLDMDYSIKIEDEKVAGNITITNKEVKKNNYEGSISFNVKYNDYKFNFKSNYKVEYGVKIADINTKNAVAANNADSKLTKALEKIGERLEDSNFYKIIQSVPTNYFTNSSTSYDYDDEDDDDYSYIYGYEDDDDDSYDYDYDYEY